MFIFFKFLLMNPDTVLYRCFKIMRKPSDVETMMNRPCSYFDWPVGVLVKSLDIYL